MANDNKITQTAMHKIGNTVCQ